MHRIDTISAQKDKFGSGKNGFTTGDPQSGTPATEVSAEILDALQEEICAAIEGAGITLDKGKNNQLLAAIQSSIYPVGAPVPWPLATPPAGFMLMTGQSFSAEMYPKLAQAYPSLTLPDMRAKFIRGWDNGRGIDTGRTLLSEQGDAMQRIYGSAESSNGFGFVKAPADSMSGAFRIGVSKPSFFATSVQTPSNGLDFDSALVTRTASETRPSNLAYNYLVRAA